MKLYLTLSNETLEQAAKNIDIILTAKSTNILNVIIRDEELQGVDISDATAFFTIKSFTTQTDTSAILKKDITSFSFPTSGEFDIELTPTDTSSLLGNYLWDLKIKLSTGKIYRLAEGTICFTQSLSTRES
jgi:hypothetical protein